MPSIVWMWLRATSTTLEPNVCCFGEAVGCRFTLPDRPADIGGVSSTAPQQTQHAGMLLGLDCHTRVKASPLHFTGKKVNVAGHAKSFQPPCLDELIYTYYNT